MAEKSRLSQSPRALRDSTENPDKHAKGSVPRGWNDPEPKHDPVNDHAWTIRGDQFGGK